MTKSSISIRQKQRDPKKGRVHHKHILVISNPTDPHIESVLKLCHSAGATSTLLTEDSLVSFEFNSSVSHEEENPTTAVWWRLKPGFFRVEEMTPPNLFMRREWNHCLEAFEGEYKSAIWINPRKVDRFVRHKPNQIRHALYCGLQTPTTLFSNDPKKVLDFVARQPQKRCIYKPFSWYSEAPDRQLFTNVVTQKKLLANKNAIRRAPGIFQEVISKKYELRITVVKNEIFAARIDSQVCAETKVDWRRNQLGLKYTVEPYIPTSLRKSLLKFHSSIGLVYGAYDFILTPEGNYIFLEVNQVGQWLWIEQATGLKISHAIAQALLS